MHMADALISPAVGGALWAAAGLSTVYCARKIQVNLEDSKIPLMGVLGAFVFAAQMINFTIPGTGSSGHLGGGLLLSILLGPHAAFLTMASILTVQALFFADGGLLALGCNIINLGFLTSFVAYPLIYRPVAGSQLARGRIMAGSVTAAVLGLQMGALAVVLETVLSGISGLPFGSFLLMMIPIHLAIGLVEGLVTATVVSFLWKARPDLLAGLLNSRQATGPQRISVRTVLAALLLITALTGGVFSWFASAHPDGLEWSLFKTAGKEELEAPEGGIYGFLAGIQRRTAVLPDYDFKKAEPEAGDTSIAEGKEGEEDSQSSWPSVNAGTSVSGLVGAVITLVVAGLLGIGLKRITATRPVNH